jgi:hypothetical protein
MPLIFDLILLGIGIFWFGTAVTGLTLWKGLSIGNGLVPGAASAIMMAMLLITISKTLRTTKINRQYFEDSFKAINWREMIPLLIAVGCIVSTFLIGMLLTMTVMVFCWLKFLSGYGIKRSALTTVGSMLFIYGVFKLWLQVPLPRGLLGIL